MSAQNYAFFFFLPKLYFRTLVLKFGHGCTCMPLFSLPNFQVCWEKLKAVKDCECSLQMLDLESYFNVNFVFSLT